MEAKLLAVLSSGMSLNVSELCADLEISRQTFYKYRRRWADEGPPGLVERSRRPHRSPGQLSAEVEDRIVRLRKELVVDNGAQAITYHLARQGGAVPSVATVHRVLVRRGLVVAQPKKRPRSAWRRFEWPRPNDAWQIDATCWALADGTGVWIMDALDDHSRVLVAARVSAGPTAQAAWDALAHGIADWGLPARVMSDNAVCFTGRFLKNVEVSEVDFEVSLRELGIEHLRSSPGHPQTCGKLERSHQTTKRWLRHLPRATSVTELQAQLDVWRQHYNHRRPHKAAGGRTPAERWAATERATPGRALRRPPRATLHRVSRTGTVAWAGYRIGLDSRRAGETVLVVARDLNVRVLGQGGQIRHLTVDPTREYQPSGRSPGPRRDSLVSAMS